jgi:tRNA(Arg) A34 adenosine deaminase TadA
MSTPAAFHQPPLAISLPDWVPERVRQAPPCANDEDRMRLAIELSRANVEHGTGGPFGAAVFERGGAHPLAIGVNRVEALANACAHAEVIALMAAQARVGSHTLRRSGAPACELFTSCAPCAMCLGAALWSGVTRIVCGATREDALALGFDEGPVFDASWRYLEARGIEVAHGVLAREARAVLASYAARGGLIYNA